MRRRDLTIGLLLAVAARLVRAQERAMRHRIAVVIPAGPVVVNSETSSDALSRRLYQSFFEELRRLGDVEGQNLIVERYSGEGRPDRFADVAREVAGRNPNVIVAISNPVVLAARSTASAPTPRLLRWPTKPPPSPFRPRGRVREGPLASASHGLVCNVRASRYAGARSCGKVTGIL